MTLDGLPSWHIASFQIDVCELLMHSPRFLSLWTMCFLSRAKFTGKKNTMQAFQFFLIKRMPAYIGTLSFIDVII